MAKARFSSNATALRDEAVLRHVSANSAAPAMA